MRALAYVAAVMAALLALNANAGQCTRGASVCTDGPATKQISGEFVFRECWNYQTVYNCDFNQVDTCATWRADSTCVQSNSMCAQTNTQTGECTIYDQTYTCTTPGSSIDHVTWGGNTCQRLVDQGCVEKSSRCILTTPSTGECSTFEAVYECTTPSGTTTTTTDCAGQTYCQGTLCTNTGHRQNDDFGDVAARIEMARQAAKYYDPATMTVFNGVDNRCTVQLWTLGLIGDCCEVTGGGQTNSMLAEQLIGGGIKQSFASVGIEVANPAAAGSVVDKVISSGTSAVGSYASNIYNSASAYMYDVFFPGGMAGKTLQDGMISGVQNMVQAHNAMQVATQAPAPVIDQSIQAAGSSPASFFDSFSYYGFTISTTAPAAGSLSLGSMGGFNFSFDPWSFAAAVALQVIMEAMQCTEQEQKLMQMRGSNLCHFVGSYCSNELDLLVATICLEESESYCCYNSKLARIVNVQGRPQIGKSWGTGEAPSCQGFTMAEMENLDFSTMDLSEFIADLTARLPDPATLQNKIQQKVEFMYNNAPPF